MTLTDQKQIEANAKKAWRLWKQRRNKQDRDRANAHYNLLKKLPKRGERRAE